MCIILKQLSNIFSSTENTVYIFFFPDIEQFFAVTYRVIDAPHKNSQDGIAGPEYLHFLMYKMFFLAFCS